MYNVLKLVQDIDLLLGQGKHSVLPKNL